MVKVANADTTLNLPIRLASSLSLSCKEVLSLGCITLRFILASTEYGPTATTKAMAVP
jgi:hypothetical protein